MNHFNETGDGKQVKLISAQFLMSYPLKVTQTRASTHYAFFA